MPSLEKALPVIIEPERPDDTVDLSSLQERHPDWPKLELSFYFAAHTTKKDMEGIGKSIDKADIILVEEIAANVEEKIFRENKLDYIHDMSIHPTDSQLEMLDGVMARGTHQEPIFRQIYASGKAIGTIDIGNSESQQQLALETFNTAYYLPDYRVDYEKALDEFRNVYKKHAELQLQRETLMVSQFEDEVGRILEARPDLKSKESVKILISMGSVHTTLRHSFTKAGQPSDRKFSTSMPYLFDHNNELLRSYMFGKKPSEDLIKRALASIIISSTILTELVRRDDIIQSEEIIKFSRRFVSDLGDEEMKRIFETYKMDKGNPDIYVLEAALLDEDDQNYNSLLPNTSKEILEANRKYEERRKRKLAKSVTAE